MGWAHTMRIVAALAAGLASALAAAAPARAAPPVSADKYRILIPLYIYPASGTGANGEWNAVAAAQEKVTVLAIVNPASGPGASDCSSFNVDYQAGILTLKQSDVTVLGYVPTGYAATAAATVKSDILSYRKCAGLNHIFLDEAAASVALANYPYYRSLYRFAHALRGGTVVINPGVPTKLQFVRRWRPAADVAVTFEGNLAAWQAAGAPAAWMLKQNPQKFAALVYGVPDEVAMKAVVDQAISRHFGLIYVTDQGLPNPWGALPPYWAAFVDYLEQKNLASAN